VQLDAGSLQECRIPSHGGSPREAWAALADLQRAGRVRAIGVSNCTASQLAEFAAIARVASVQVPYSLLQPDVEDDLLPSARAQGVGVLAASPMASGLLTGAMTGDRHRLLPCNDWRRGQVTADLLDRATRIVARLREVGARHSVVPGAVAIAWALRHSAVTATIAGARRPGQVDELVSAAQLRLDEVDLTNLAAERALQQ
jgi:aryl-alcohol dehydrogenase-like predicted oxidoreductase